MNRASMVTAMRLARASCQGLKLGKKLWIVLLRFSHYRHVVSMQMRQNGSRALQLLSTKDASMVENRCGVGVLEELLWVGCSPMQKGRPSTRNMGSNRTIRIEEPTMPVLNVTTQDVHCSRCGTTVSTNGFTTTSVPCWLEGDLRFTCTSSIVLSSSFERRGQWCSFWSLGKRFCIQSLTHMSECSNAS